MVRQKERTEQLCAMPSSLVLTGCVFSLTQVIFYLFYLLGVSALDLFSYSVTHNSILMRVFAAKIEINTTMAFFPPNFLTTSGQMNKLIKALSSLSPCSGQTSSTFNEGLRDLSFDSATTM